MNDLSQRLAGLSPSKRKWLEQQLHKLPSGAEPAGIPRRNPETLARLSFAQERLWFLNQVEPCSPAYNVRFALRMHGCLDSGALQRCLSDIVHRHDVLRTKFTLADGIPTQQVGAYQPLALPIVDLGEVPESQRESELQRHLAEEGRRPFDLARDQLLLRAKLLRCADQDHVLQLTMHHIASDGWSMGVLYRELSELYNAFCNGQPSPLPDLAIQYADFAEWQRATLDDESLAKHVSYWKQQLDGVPPVVELPTDRPRSAALGDSGTQLPLTIDETLTKALHELSRREGVTLFMTILAAFQTWMHRICGQDDIVVGAPIAGRGQPQLDGMIGFFSNTLALRTNFADNPTFRELLLRVRATALDAFQHDQTPFEKLVAELRPERSLGHSPLVQVMFAWQNAPTAPLNLQGLTIRPQFFDSGTATFDLTLSLGEASGRLEGYLQFRTALFESATISRLLGYFQNLLQGIVANPEQRIGELPLMTDAECRQIVVEWNDTAAEYPQNKCVHRLFEEQVERTPEAVAIQFGDRFLTYRELNASANQLAHRLRNFGVGSETLVGLCLDRSLDLVIGILGILKAGGAYLPLDAAYPRQRLQFMIDDAGVEFLVTQSSLQDRLPTLKFQVVAIDDHAAACSSLPLANPPANTGADNLAYVMYTSGSTGQPKGVAIRHQSIARLVFGNRFANMGGDRVFLQLAPVAFDASTFELWGALLHGAKLVIAPPGILDVHQIVDIMNRHRVTTVWLTASLFNQFVDAGPIALTTVDEILTGGEALSVEHVLRAQDTFGPRVTLVNGYGPTESTTFATTYRIPHNIARESESIPIGRPIGNTQVYVLDARREPVPIGVRGELYLGGAGLAREYLRRPALTAEKFVPNPFSDKPDSRLYRTGDLCRWRADGQLEFLGRLDDQVKLRGHRIELGEIEAALAKHRKVSQAVVVVREDSPGDKRLVAYVVLREESDFITKELRSLLEGQLPDFMIPSAFVPLSELPLTPHGKIDRRSLPPPSDAQRRTECEFVAPRNPVEEHLAAIWCEVLRVKNVGVHDNFFALGGHSLLAIQIVAKVRDKLQVELPVRELFEAPTVAALAQRLSISRQSDGSSSVPQLTARPAGATPQLSFAQERLWFLHQLESDSPVYNVPVGLRLRGHLDIKALELSLNEIVRRHEVLRSTFPTSAGQPQLSIAPEAEVQCAVTDLSHLPIADRESEAWRFAAMEARHLFDISRGGLVRFSLIRLADNDHLLILNFHHIVIDGWSLGILWRELVTLYGAYVAGGAAPLAQLPAQYADFAAWQRQLLQGDVRQRQVNYWREKLADAPAILDLPTDRPRPAIPTSNGARRTTQIDTNVTRRILELSRREGATPFMTLLAAFQALLSRLSGQCDIVVGSPVAGRTHDGLEGLIGLFVNTLTLRANLSGNPSFLDLLKQVRETAIGAFAHQDLPFEQLIQELHPSRSLGRSPLFQVMFSFQPAQSLRFEMSELDVEIIPFDHDTAKFDLSWSVTETTSGLRVLAEYSTDLFDATTIDKILEQNHILLMAIIAAPDRPLSELQLLTDSERQLVLDVWSQTDSAPLSDVCLHELIERQVERSPNAVALDFDGGTITYRELDERANKLAHFLRKSGVRPDDVVGLLLERSPEMVIGMLGVLKAGGAYMPLDVDHPAERIAYQIGNARTKLVLTQQQFRDLLPTDGLTAFCLDSDELRLAAEPKARPERSAQSNHLAYVLYTSGSTGRPKGVMVEHRSIAKHLLWMQSTFPLGPDDRVIMKYSIGFDPSVVEVFGTLLAGARLILARPTGQYDPSYLAELIRSREITRLDVVPSFLESLLDQPAFCNCSQLRHIFAGGEALADATRKEVQSALSCVELINFYGPTEATISTTYWVCPRRDARQFVPIGQPVGHSRVYVLDARMNPVPIGSPGELYIGGAMLARGYINQPELTAERFVADPFRGAGARMYRTGDRARWLSDGVLEFRGRVDDQVKIRGVRIELDEIGQRLREHPAVEESCVIAADDATGDKRLIAYVAPDRRSIGVRGRSCSLWPAVGDFGLYDELMYSAMTNDEARNRHYRASIARLVKDQVVVDIGTGRDAILSRFCVEFGARKVYSLEIDREAYQGACECVRKLGLQDRIHILFGNSQTIELPEAADICVSELIGVIGNSEGAASILNDARRFLKPDGRMIPERVVTLAAGVEMPADFFHDLGFSRASVTYANRIFEHFGKPFDLRLCVDHLDQTHLLTASDRFEDIGFTERGQPEFTREIRLEIRRNGRLDGLLLWLNLYTEASELLDSLRETTNWLPVFFPLFHPGVAVRSGDRIEATCSARLSDDGIHPDYHVAGRLIRSMAECQSFEFTSPHRAATHGGTPFYQALFRDGAELPVKSGEWELSSKSLRTFLAKSLPTSHMPSSFMVLDALPHLACGKVDRKALPIPDESGELLASEFAAARNSIEEQLCAIWREVLGVDSISIHDNFFDIGGHSLLAIRLFTLIEQAFSRKLPLAMLFQHGTISQQAKLLEESAPSSEIANVIVLQSGGKGRPLFVLPSVGGELLFSKALIDGIGKHSPVFGIQPELTTRNLEVFQDFRSTAEHFVRTLRAFQPKGPYAFLGYSYGGLIAAEMASRLSELGEKVHLLAVIDTGPGKRRKKPRAAERLARLMKIGINLPFWVREECRHFSAKYWKDRVLRGIRRLYRRVASRGNSRVELDDLFDVSLIPSQNRELMRAVYFSVSDYKPRHYTGKVTLFRAKTRPLLRVSPKDLGWGRFADEVEVRHIQGNHETILRPPLVGQIIEQLAELLPEDNGS